MALFKRKNMDNILLFLIPLLLCPPLMEAKNINCNSRSFHCVNSTHFMICVDLGGGVSMTIDNFVIRCPPTTFCYETNNFECEYQASTTQKTKFDVTNVFADINGVNNAVTKLVPNELDSDAFKVQGELSDINEIQTTHVNTDNIKIKNVFQGNLQNSSIYNLHSVEMELKQNKSLFQIPQYNMTNTLVNDSVASNLYSMKKIINNHTKEVLNLFTTLENIITTPRDKIAFENITTANELNLEHTTISGPIVSIIDLGENIGNTVLSNTSLFTTVKNVVVKIPINKSDSNNARTNESAYETATDNKLVNNIQLPSLNFDVYAQYQTNTFEITESSIDSNIKSEVTTTSDTLSDTIIAETFSFGMYETSNNRVNNTTTISVPKDDFMTIKNQIHENTQVTNPYRIEMDLRVYNKSVFTTPMNIINTNIENLVHLNAKKILTNHHIKELLSEGTENVRYENLNYKLNNIGESHVLSMASENIFATQTNNTAIQYITSDNQPILELTTISNSIVSPTHTEENTPYVISNTSFNETFKNDVTKLENYSFSNSDRINVLVYEIDFNNKVDKSSSFNAHIHGELQNNAFASTEKAINLLSEVTTTADMLSDTVTVGIFFPRVQETDMNGVNNDPIKFVSKEKSTNTETYKVEGGLNDVIKTIYDVNTSDDLIYTNNLKNKNILHDNHKNTNILDSHKIEMKSKERNKNIFNIAPNNMIETHVENSLDLNLRSNKTLINSHSHTKEFLSNKSDIINYQKFYLNLSTIGESNKQIDALTTNTNYISKEGLRTAVESTTSISVGYKAKADLPHILRLVAAKSENSNEEVLKLNTNMDKTMGLRAVEKPYVMENFTEINFAISNSENNEALEKHVTYSSDQKFPMERNVSETAIKQNLAKNTTASPTEIFLSKNNEPEKEYTVKEIENMYNVMKKIYQPTSEKSIFKNSKTREFLFIADGKYQEISYNKSKPVIEYVIQNTLERPIYLINTSSETYTKEHVNQDINIINKLGNSSVGTSGIPINVVQEKYDSRVRENRQMPNNTLLNIVERCCQSTSKTSIAINDTSDKRLYGTKIGDQENHNETAKSFSNSLTKILTVINETEENYKPVKERNLIISTDSRPNIIANLTQSFSEKSTLDNRRQDTFMNVSDNQETISDFLTIAFTITDKKAPKTSITVQPFEISNLSKLLEVNDSVSQVLSSQATQSLFGNKLSKTLDNINNTRNITLLSVGEYNLTQLDESVTNVKMEDSENNNIFRQQQILQTTYFADITTSLPNTQENSLVKYPQDTPSVSIDVLTGVNSQLKFKTKSTLSQYDDVVVDNNKIINTLSNKTLKQYCLNDTTSNISLENKLTATESNYKSTKGSVHTTNKLLNIIHKRNNSYHGYNATGLVPKNQQTQTTDKSLFAVKPFVYGYKINLTSEGNFNNVSTKMHSKEDKIGDSKNLSYSVNNNVSKSDTILKNDLVKSVKCRTTITSIKTSRTHKQLLPNTFENASVELGNSSKINKPILNFDCRNRSRGRFADEGNCRKFYICIGIVVPILGLCPMNTVFSEFQKQCTRNLSHCVRKNQFQCVSEGRFIDVWEDNIYYICVKGTDHRFIRFKFQCQNGYRIDKMSLTCKNVKEIIKLSSSSLSSSLYDGDNKKTTRTIIKQRTDKKLFINNESFKCEKEGKFSDPSNCRRYYVCTKTSKLILRRKRKRCDSDEVFDKDKNKCVDQDSHEC